MDTFKEPRELPCGHTFCTICLERLIEDSQFVDCPSCRSKHVIPRNGFRIDFRTNRLLDILNEVNNISIKY